MSRSNGEIERIESSWRQLEELIAGLPSLDARTGDSGWAVKDHLVHITAWEQSLIALLEGRDRLTEMGVPGVKPETDVINEAVWKLHRDDSPEKVLADFHRSHQQLAAALEKLSDADLQKPYSHYQPDDPDEKRPVIGWIAGNTYEHYDEHRGWIEEALAAQRR